MTIQQTTPHPPAMGIGLRLKVARSTRGMRQQDIARVLELSRATVSEFENGQRRPRKTVVLAWAYVTGVDPAWLEDSSADATMPTAQAEQLSAAADEWAEAVRNGPEYTPTDSNREPADYAPGWVLAA